MPSNTTTSRPQIPFLVFLDEAGFYPAPQPPLNSLSSAQRAAVRSFEDAVERVLSTVTVDKPRPDEQALEQLSKLAEDLAAGDDAVRAHIDHISLFRLFPATLRMTVAEFQALHQAT